MRTAIAFLILTGTAFAADAPKAPTMNWHPAPAKSTYEAAREQYVTRSMISRQQEADRRILEAERQDAYQFRYGRFGN